MALVSRMKDFNRGVSGGLPQAAEKNGLKTGRYAALVIALTA